MTAHDTAALILFPIPRTDEDAARAFLAWLAASDYSYHIDDDPCECPTMSEHIAPHIRNRTEECFAALGYNQAWATYSKHVKI